MGALALLLSARSSGDDSEEKAAGKRGLGGPAQVGDVVVQSATVPLTVEPVAPTFT